MNWLDEARARVVMSELVRRAGDARLDAHKTAHVLHELEEHGFIAGGAVVHRDCDVIVEFTVAGFL